MKKKTILVAICIKLYFKKTDFKQAQQKEIH